MADDWKRKLWKPVKPKGGKPLETLLHAKIYMLGIPPNFETKPEWQRASRAIAAAAKDKENARAAWSALVEALAINGRLDQE